ncbi:MAG: hypothetical protein Q9183_001637 [Haloplaca sp. 2 TL-2023]
MQLLDSLCSSVAGAGSFQSAEEQFLATASLSIPVTPTYPPDITGINEASGILATATPEPNLGDPAGGASPDVFPQFPYKDAWTRARDRYVEDLSKEEKASYATASPETILYEASAAEYIHSSSSSSIKITDKLRPLIAAIEQYGKALDVYTNTYSLVLSPLWGSIRIVLVLASEFGKYFDRIVDMFARIGDVLPRFRVYENLFPSHERLIRALSIVYVDILTFCTGAKAVFRHERRPSRINLGIFAKLTWKPFERQFQHHIDSFRVHVRNIEKEATLSNMIEAADSRAVVLANQRQLETAKKVDAYRRIIATIPSVDMYTKQKRLRALRQEGTGTWILHHDEYRTWYEAISSAALCCFGIPGCGKTILASSIVDILQSDTLTHKSSVVAYYYCDYAAQKTLQPGIILGTILKQFFDDRIPKEMEYKFPRGFGEGAHVLDVGDLVDLICTAIKINPLTFLVIDGLDECDKSTRREILTFLDRLEDIGISTVKTLITCRQEDQLLRSLSKVAKVQLTPSTLKNDIRLFVTAGVQLRIRSNDLTIRDPQLANEIIDELVNKADGMFLWVYFQLDDLCEAPSDALIRHTLKHLPNGLMETYERILNRVWRGPIPRDIVRRIFMWLVCARRPLDIEELREAAGFEPNQESWDSDRLPDANRIVEACKGLVIWDREDGTVRFAHHTVRQFLLSDNHGTHQTNIKFRDHEEETFVGEMCLTYLLFSDFETQIQAQPAETQITLPQGGPAYWIPQMLGISLSRLQQPLRLFGFSSRPLSAQDGDYAKLPRPASRTRAAAPSREIVEKYRLLQYVIENWVHHTKQLDPTSREANKLQVLAMSKTLPFEFRPWGQNQHCGPYGCGLCIANRGNLAQAQQLPFMSLLHYAAEAGHWPLMEPLIKDYYAHEIDESFSLFTDTFLCDSSPQSWHLLEPLEGRQSLLGQTTDWTVCIAAQNGHLSIVERLMPCHSTLLYCPSPTRFTILINTAASSGREEVLRYLLDRARLAEHRLFNEYISGCAHITLALAAANGHESIVKTLWQEGALLDATVDDRGETAISAAAANGHAHVVGFLLGKGARKLRHDMTPLHRAAERGHANLARALVQLPPGNYLGHPPNVLVPPHLSGALDRHGETPLHKAAINGHAEVVKVLLEHGPLAKDAWLRAGVRGDVGRVNLGKNAYHLAVAHDHLAVVQLLHTQMDLAFVSEDVDGATIQMPIDLAVEGNHISTARWLIGENKKSGKDALDLSSALEIAVEKGHVEMALILLDSQTGMVDLDIVNLAAVMRYGIILEILIDAHRRERLPWDNETTKEFLFRAWKRTQKEGQREAGVLLMNLWQREPVVPEAKRRHAID